MTYPSGPWEVLGADAFHFNNKNYLCIVDYHNKFPVIKRMGAINGESNHHYKDNICRILDTMKNDVRCWHQLCFRQIQEILQEAQHQANSHQHIITKVMGSWKPALNSVNANLKNVPTLVGKFTWHYCKSILPHWDKVC